MKSILFILTLPFILQSCSYVPGQYLNKTDPTFFSEKKDHNILANLEQSGSKSGVQATFNYALGNHFFAGSSLSFYKDFIKSGEYKMRGFSFRPRIGYFTDFGVDNAMHFEMHAGAGKQINRYSTNYESIAAPFQIYGGAFMGCRMKGKKIGFDIAYEHNYFSVPVYLKESRYTRDEDEDPKTIYINKSFNFTTSFYVFKSINKNLELYFNPGLNIGYTAVFIRLGVSYKL